MDKCDALNYRQSNPNHAVIIRGYNLEKGKTNGFLVENSWGQESGFEGNYYMNLDWFKNMYMKLLLIKNLYQIKLNLF